MSGSRRRSRGHRWALLALLCAAACGDAPPRPDVYLISVDTLRADRLGAYGSEAGLTPELDALARESVVFEHAFGPAPFTLPSVSALLTGRHPEVTGMRSNMGRLPDAVPTLATRLRAAGFRTGAVVSNFALRDVTGLDRDFEVYDDRFTGREVNRRQPERAARDTTDAGLAVLDRLLAEGGDAPVLLWVHFQDPHGPYTPPPELRERLLARPGADDPRELPVAKWGLGGIPSYQVLGDERRVGFYRAGYDAEVLYTDREIGRLLAGIAERRDLDGAIVVFASDHGEGLGEDDYWFAHGELLTDPLVRVPLLLRAPGLAPARRSDPASLLDVLPTVAARLGLPLEESEGRDLLAPGAEAATPSLLLSTFEESRVPRRALVHDGFKYVEERVPGARRERLVRIGDDATDLGPNEATRLEALRERLAREEEALPRFEGLRQDLSDVERARLEALGYLEAD